MKILAIESSCDDTAAAVWVDQQVLSNVVSSQLIHEQYGGVVPEVASRAHQANILPTVDQALQQANIKLEELDAIAFTQGPGLMGSLMVGAAFAKGLAMAHQKPLIGVHHMEAHVLAHFAERPYPDFPFLCLTVSGGHTQIVRVNTPLDQEVLGSTLDDAAGEAFDKSGKLLGLPYPAGPQIDRLAKQGKAIYPLPKPRIAELDFSFSGLKTAILNFLQRELKKNPNFIQENLADICASIQDRIVSILIDKLEKAVEKTGLSRVAVAGGVSANSGLRAALQEKAAQSDWEVFIPKLEYCTDNAAMIAVAAHYKYLAGEFVGLDAVPSPRF